MEDISSVFAVKRPGWNDKRVVRSAELPGVGTRGLSRGALLTRLFQDDERSVEIPSKFQKIAKKKISWKPLIVRVLGSVAACVSTLALCYLVDAVATHFRHKRQLSRVHFFGVKLMHNLPVYPIGSKLQLERIKCSKRGCNGCIAVVVRAALSGEPLATHSVEHPEIAAKKPDASSTAYTVDHLSLDAVPSASVVGQARKSSPSSQSDTPLQSATSAQSELLEQNPPPPSSAASSSSQNESPAHYSPVDVEFNATERTSYPARELISSSLFEDIPSPDWGANLEQLATLERDVSTPEEVVDFTQDLSPAYAPFPLESRLLTNDIPRQYPGDPDGTMKRLLMKPARSNTKLATTPTPAPDTTTPISL